ncbi:Guanylyl cyclase [Geranomyces variabilis]|nr:Guanylyl cyclase [Geranomyces variabilis]
MRSRVNARPCSCVSVTYKCLFLTSQLSNWDCGLACVSMVLSSLAVPHTLLELRNAADDPVRDGVWTIDLAYHLGKYGVQDFTYYTSYIGVNQQYTRTRFYSATLSRDRQRIHALFAGAHERNIRVVAWTLPLDDMIRFLDSARYAILVLVDLALLTCRECGHGWARRRTRGDSETRFVGHYVLLVGYDARTDRFLYRDPGTAHELCAVDADRLDEARRADGTDCDAIVVRVR